MIKTLKKLEKNLGFKLKDNTFCLAFDTATKSGIAIVDIVKGKVSIMTDILKLVPMTKDAEDKAEIYEEKLADFWLKVDIFAKDRIPNLENRKSLLILENSFLKMNVVTFGFLRALQGIVYAKLKPKFDDVKIIFPVAARKLVGFESRLGKKAKSKDKKKEIVKWISNVVEEAIDDDNKADALLLAFAGLKQ